MPEMSSKERYKFKRDLEQIEECVGRGTELISLYVPPNKQISDVANYLRNEYSQSSNIKSKSTRKNVMAAIESILSKLRYFKNPPPNGVIFFVGHRQMAADQTEMVSFVLEPPEPITTFLYRCNSQFYTQPLREILAEKDLYGLIVIDRSEATIGLLRGKRIEVIKNIQSLVPSKHGRGGQSQRRFERLIEIAAHEYFTKVGNLANEAFLGEKEMKGILIGGPGATKDFFAGKEYLHHELRKKIIDTFDTGYTDEYGLRELMEKAQDSLSTLDLMREKRLIQNLLNEIRKAEGGLAVYGEEEVRKALKAGAVDILLLSEALRKLRVELKCSNCGYQEKRTMEEVKIVPCPKCQTSLQVVSKDDMVDEFSRIAESAKSTLEMISRDSEEGDLFLKAFGGLAGILRYKVS